MTLVVAVIHHGQVCMLGDSIGAAVESGTYSIQREPKVFVLGELLIGFTTSFRMGQILQHDLKIRTRKPDVDVGMWMRTAFIDAVRKAFQGHGFGDGKNSSGGSFLIGVQGRLFEVQDDYAVLENALPYAAVGSGVYHAQGAIAALRGRGVTDPEEQLLEAARAVRQHMMWVAPPWHLRWSSSPDILKVVES